MLKKIIQYLVNLLFKSTLAKNAIVVNFIKPKRIVHTIFIHCTATDSNNYGVEDIRKDHLLRGFKDIGYHFVILRNGLIKKGRDLEMTPSSQKGFNIGSIAICVCGLKNFTKESMKSLIDLCKKINKSYYGIKFKGHCEVNKNKTCPVFNYKKILNLDNNGFIK